MMDDKDLLTYAAKAAKIFVTPETWPYSGTPITPEDMETYFDPEELSITGTRVWFGFDGEIGGTEEYTWNPLGDDGEAFRLMVKLELFDLDECLVNLAIKENDSQHIDQYAATRRAIVMAAAEIGKGM
nr:hypothetical protein [uncultured Undibacterium sp.]